ncbi:MAG: hypothetical protein DUD32_09970 [Lactobacillus sp.]|nr:MAG: hypothetical protein DUD32_09970 [Lactobacillus sp.]
MYRPEIEARIEKLRKVNGAGTYSLDGFNQNDVKDTMNYLHLRYPNIYDSSDIYYTGLADVSILR